MIKLYSLLFIILFQLYVNNSGCNDFTDAATGIDSVPLMVRVDPRIREASGIADSKKNKGSLWVHEDSGNPPVLYLLRHNGTIRKKMFLKGAVNQDWEELQLAGNDIYIGDIGDNLSRRQQCVIYRFPEPLAATDTIRQWEAIHFRYADGPHDAEAFLVEPATKAIYIITKRDSLSSIYKITFPFDKSINTAQKVGTLRFNGVVGAAMAPNGKEVIVKTYSSLLAFRRLAAEPLEQVLQKAFTPLPYQIESQGEAVAYTNKGDGYFTLSEKGFFGGVKLHFYKKK